MAIDFKPEQNDYTNLTPFKTWLLYQINTWGVNNFPFLENDFDQLTNYGMMMKLMKAMNDIISNQNKVEEDMSKLYEAFTELQNYINNYFDNNFPELVNNKLDEMAEDGTLENLLNNKLNIKRTYNTLSEMLDDKNNLVQDMYIETMGIFTINDGNGATYRITDTPGKARETINLENGLYAVLVNNFQNNFYDEITYTYERHNDTDCYLVEIPLNDKEGNQINLEVGKRESLEQTPLNYAQDKITTLTTNNCVLVVSHGVTPERREVVTAIGNGVVLVDNDLAGVEGIPNNFLYLGITDNRDILEFRVNDTTTEQLVNSGCKNVFNIYYKIIENYNALDLSNVQTNEDGVVTNKGPRQVLCEMNDKTLYIFSCDGRNPDSLGLTSAETQNILIEKGVKNAWMMDGGGSVSTSVRTVKINRNLDGGGKVDRAIPFTLNVRKPIKNKPVGEIYSYFSKLLHFLNIRYQDERIKMRNLADKDANELIGKLIFGYGIEMTNTPTKFGYFINMTNTIYPQNFLLYNKQIFMDSNSYEIWERTMYNGVWSYWQNIKGVISSLVPSGAVTITINNDYNTIPINQVIYRDGNSGITLNNDGTFTFDKKGHFLMYMQCNIRGSSGEKWIKLEKTHNGVTEIVSRQVNYNPDTNKHQIVLIGRIDVNDVEDIYTLSAFGKENDIVDNISIFIR